MFTKKDVADALSDEQRDITSRLNGNLKTLAMFAAEGYGNFTFRGLSITLKPDGSVLGVLRVTVEGTKKDNLTPLDGWDVGDYVAIVGGSSVGSVLAKVELALAGGDLELVPDRFTSGTQGGKQKAPRGARRRD